MVLSILLLLTLETASIPHAVLEIAFVVGLWKVFEKCGMAGWRALIPFYKYYHLGEIVNMESEGMACMLLSFVTSAASIPLLFMPDDSTIYMLLNISILIGEIIDYVYLFRLYRNVAILFRVKTRLVFLWIFLDCVPFCILGFVKKFQPAWQVEDAKNDPLDFLSGAQAQVLDAGLTINLNKRTARQFMKTKTLLRDVHMEIKPGRMVLLLGGSGAGKTTLLDAVIGYEKADAKIMLNGVDVYEHYQRMQYEVGYVPQLDLMRGQDTAFHTLMDAAALRLPTSFSRQQRRDRVEHVMDIFGLTPGRNTMVDKMSGGQRKRLSIAMEFIPNPSLFILDEPDSGLDGVMARELMQQLRTIADQGKIVMVITHTPDRVIDLFDDVIVLAKDSKRTGRLAYYGPIEEARTFFGEHTMEGVVKCINSKDMGGKGLADEYIKKFVEVQHG